MKFGCCASAKLYKEVVEAGYDYIEIPGYELVGFSDKEFETVKNEILTGPINCIAVNAYAKTEPKMVGDDVDDEKTRSYAEFLMKRAFQLGVKTVGIGAAGIRKLPEDYDMDKAWKQGKKFLEITADVAKKYNITILFESIHKFSCQFGCDVEEVNKMVEEINLPNVKMVYDFYQMKPMGTNIFDVEKYMKNTVHLHTSGIDDNFARPQLTQKDYGELVEIFKLMKKLGYDETISNESDNSKFETEGKYALEVMKKAYENA